MIEPFNWQDFAIGDHRIVCPACGNNKRTKNAGLKVDTDGAVLHCFKCSYVETFRDKSHSVRRAPRVHAPSQNEPKRTTLSDWGRELWQSAQELSGVAVAYLEHRHCVMPPAYGALRWHSALRHPTGYTGPCLVALISDTHSNKPLSLHRTWITATGKADVSPPRLLLANHAIKNGVIKLWPDEDVGHTLGIAEGIETALSMAHAVQPVWACIDAGHLGALSGDLYRSFSEWKSAQGEHAPSNKAFSQRLERMFSKKTTKHGKAFQGLILKAYSTGGSYAEQSRGE